MWIRYYAQYLVLSPQLVWRIGGEDATSDTFILEWNFKDLTHRYIPVTSGTETIKGFAFKVENADGKEEVCLSPHTLLCILVTCCSSSIVDLLSARRTYERNVSTRLCNKGSASRARNTSRVSR